MIRLRPTALTLLLMASPAAASEDVFATYWANSGSLPPEYAWDVTVSITESGKVTLRHCTGYQTEGPGCRTRKGKATPAQLDAIRAAVAESGLLDTPAQEAPGNEIPIGGGASGGSVIIDGRTVDLMAFPQAKDASRVGRVLGAVYAAIPARLAKRFIEGN